MKASSAAFLLLLSLSSPTLHAAEEPTEASNVRAELLSETESLQPGSVFTLALRLKMSDGWHTYWRNPGESGMATAASWKLPEGFRAGELRWPVPERFKAAHSTSFGYGKEAILLADVYAPPSLKEGQSADLAVKVRWLECREACVPGSSELTLRLPVKAAAPLPKTELASLFSEARRRLPDQLGAGALADWSARASRDGQGIRLRLEPPADAAAPAGTAPEADFFPILDGVVADAEPLKVEADGKAVVMLLSPARTPKSSPASRLSGVVVLKDRKLAMEVASPIEDPEEGSCNAKKPDCEKDAGSDDGSGVPGLDGRR